MTTLKQLVLLAALLVVSVDFVRAQKPDFLAEEEQDKLREAQDPSERIKVYLGLAQIRLERLEALRAKPPDPKRDNGASLDSLLAEYIALNEELKNWIEAQYQRNGDIRDGLRALLEQGSRQLAKLRRIRQSSDANASAHGDTLREAIDDLTDTLDGASKALAGQEKKFAEMKRDEKAAARNAKERRKEEEKRTKEERKLRKQRGRGVPADSDEH